MEKLKGYLFAIISASTYGLIPLFILPIKQANFSLDVTLFYRFLISAAFIAAIILLKKKSLMIPRNEWIYMIALGLFYALSSEFLFQGYDLLTPGIASTILFAYPVIVALIMVLAFKEKLKPLTIGALLISFVGILVLSAQESLLDLNFLGLTVSLGAALFYALYIVTVNQAKLRASGLQITCYSMFFASVFFGVKSIFNQESLMLPSWIFLGDLTVFSLVTTVLSMLTLVYAIQLIGSTPTSIMGALEPVVAILVSVLLFHEAVTMNLIIGVVLILFGVLMNIWVDAQKPKANLSK